MEKEKTIAEFISGIMSMEICNEFIEATGIDTDIFKWKTLYSVEDSAIFTYYSEDIYYKDVLLLTAFLNFAPRAKFGEYIYDDNFYHHNVNDWLVFKLADEIFKECGDYNRKSIHNTILLGIDYPKVDCGVACCDLPNKIFEEYIENVMSKIYHTNVFNREDINKLPVSQKLKNKLFTAFDR